MKTLQMFYIADMTGKQYSIVPEADSIELSIYVARTALIMLNQLEHLREYSVSAAAH